MDSNAVCGRDWAMLLPESLWYPELKGSVQAYRLRVLADPGIIAVSQGRLLGREQGPEQSLSVWDIPKPVERFGLSLARYEFEQSQGRAALVQTFLLEASRNLAKLYLDSANRHLDFYANLHGPYAFEKFAVAENPLPTGYGFPSYTLLGSQVIALPFIPATSLRHEIAHSWWGNGVLVAEASGNWCEGLTTYVADYLAQEEKSPQDAKDYRLKTLRSFAALVDKGRDMPLSAFRERHSPASQAVGYGKAMFVFHMLRGFVGDEAFWRGLREFYAQRKFKPSTWEDIRKVFTGTPGFDDKRSQRFFRQWLTRTGGPILKLDELSSKQRADGGYNVSLRISQLGDPYLLKLSLLVQTQAGDVVKDFIMDNRTCVLNLAVPGKPLRAVLDPQANSFRLLEPSELPPSVNSLKGSRNLSVLLAKEAPASLRAALPVLLAGLGQEQAKVVREESLDPAGLAKLKQGDLLLAGRPENPELGLSDTLWPEASEADVLFAVSSSPGGFTALFQASPAAEAQAVAAAAGKITHYGSYARLGFKDGRNLHKQTPEPESSPLIRNFQP